MKNRKAYIAPTVKRWGTVADLTQVGRTRVGGDAKEGSVYHAKGR
jgi:hypothetical protein